MGLWKIINLTEESVMLLIHPKEAHGFMLSFNLAKEGGGLILSL